jgi:long-chain fatty acid transport protein
VPAGVDLAQVFITPNFAKTIGYGVSVGGGPVLALQRFQAQGLQAFANPLASSAPGYVTNQGYDYSVGAGFKIGAAWDAKDWLTLGVAYQTRTWMTDFGKYKGLFADGGNFDVPPQITEGITVRPLKTLDVSLEHEHIFYGDVASIANAGDAAGLLGSKGGKGFGWQDMDVFRVGLEWRAVEGLALRTGFSHATDFTNGNNALFNVLAPATVKDHVAVGAAYDISPNWNVSVAYIHAFSSTLDGWNQFDPSQSIKLRMDQDEATVGVKYRW